MSPMSRAQILRYLAEHKIEFQQRFGLTSLGLAGSFARDEATEQSDIDIIVQLQSDNTFRSFFQLLHVLQDAFPQKVDLATEQSLKPQVRSTILKDIYYV